MLHVWAVQFEHVFVFAVIVLMLTLPLVSPSHIHGICCSCSCSSCSWIDSLQSNLTTVLSFPYCTYVFIFCSTTSQSLCRKYSKQPKYPYSTAEKARLPVKRNSWDWASDVSHCPDHPRSTTIIQVVMWRGVRDTVIASFVKVSAGLSAAQGLNSCLLPTLSAVAYLTGWY